MSYALCILYAELTQVQMIKTIALTHLIISLQFIPHLFFSHGTFFALVTAVCHALTVQCRDVRVQFDGVGRRVDVYAGDLMATAEQNRTGQNSELEGDR